MPGTGLIITLGGLIALLILFSGLKARRPKPKGRAADSGGGDSGLSVSLGDRRGDRDANAKDNDSRDSDSGESGGGDGGGSD
jgi:hypothetical protein